MAWSGSPWYPGAKGVAMPSHILRRERKSGVRWTVRFPTGVLDENGKPKLQIKTFRYQRDAKEYLKTLEDAKTEGKPVTESEQTLKAFLDEYLEARDAIHTDLAKEWAERLATGRAHYLGKLKNLPDGG